MEKVFGGAPIGVYKPWTRGAGRKAAPARRRGVPDRNPSTDWTG